MPENMTSEAPQLDPHEERRLEVMLDQGVIDQTEADIISGLSTGKSSLDNDTIAAGVKAGHTVPAHRRRRVASSRIERGTPSGTDISLQIMKDEAQNQEPAAPLSEKGLRAKAEVRDIARRASYTGFLSRIIDLPVTEQMAMIRAWEEKHPIK